MHQADLLIVDVASCIDDASNVNVKGNLLSGAAADLVDDARHVIVAANSLIGEENLVIDATPSCTDEAREVSDEAILVIDAENWLSDHILLSEAPTGPARTMATEKVSGTIRVAELPTRKLSLTPFFHFALPFFVTASRKQEAQHMERLFLQVRHLVL